MKDKSYDTLMTKLSHHISDVRLFQDLGFEASGDQISMEITLKPNDDGHLVPKVTFWLCQNNDWTEMPSLDEAMLNARCWSERNL